MLFGQSKVVFYFLVQNWQEINKFFDDFSGFFILWPKPTNKTEKPRSPSFYLSIIQKSCFEKKVDFQSWQTPMPIVVSLQISKIAFQLFSLGPVPAEGLKIRGGHYTQFYKITKRCQFYFCQILAVQLTSLVLPALGIVHKRRRNFFWPFLIPPSPMSEF